VDAVAHRTIPFTLGLSKMPMINSHLVCPTPVLPPQSLMDSAYSALKGRAREKLLAEWSSHFLTPGYYLHPPRCLRGVSWAWESSLPGEYTK